MYIVILGWLSKAFSRLLIEMERMERLRPILVVDVCWAVPEKRISLTRISIRLGKELSPKDTTMLLIWTSSNRNKKIRIRVNEESTI